MRTLGVLLPAIFLQAASPQSNGVRLASIEGIVVKAGTNTPIAGATVELTGIATRSVEGSATAGPGVISVLVQETESNGRVVSYLGTTRDDGRFTIRNIRPGENFQLVAMHFPDFVPAQYGQRVPAVPGRPITLIADQHLTDVRVEMTPTATISGHVLDRDGRPLRNVAVELRRPYYLEGWRLLVDWGQTIGRVRGIAKSGLAGSTRTNARGEFSFFMLAPAQYYIRTGPTAEQTSMPINLHAGENVTDMNFTVLEPRRRRIRGEVVNSVTGAPVERAQVTAVRRDAVPLDQTARVAAVTTRMGFFEITLPDSGNYILDTVAAGRPAMRGRKAVNAGALDIADLLVSVAPNFEISGRLTVEGRAPAVSPSVAPLVLSLYPLSSETPWGSPTNLPLGGAFIVGNVTAGDYRFEITPILTSPPSPLVSPVLQNSYVKSIRLGNKDVLDNGLHIEAETKDTLQIVLSMNGGSAQGRVVDFSGKPVPNARAILVPESARRQRGDLYKNAATDESGRFQLTGIAPGTYKLFAWERIEDGAWQDPQFIRLFEDKGTSVQIRENQQVMIETHVIPAWN